VLLTPVQLKRTTPRLEKNVKMNPGSSRSANGSPFHTEAYYQKGTVLPCGGTGRRDKEQPTRGMCDIVCVPPM